MHKIWINGRQTSFFFKQFATAQETINVLNEIKSDYYDSIEEYVSENLESSGIEFEEIYFCDIQKDNVEIDHFDPTRELSSDQINYTTIENFPSVESGKENFFASLFFWQSLKATFEGSFETDQKYSREKISVEINQFKIKHKDENSTFDHAEFYYDGSEIDLNHDIFDGSSSGSLVILKDDIECLEIEIYEEIDDIIAKINEIK